MKRTSVSLLLMSLTWGSGAYADAWQLQGTGACRNISGNQLTPIATQRDVGWNRCRRMCEQNADCFGVEYNLRTDRTVCEQHGTFVFSGPEGDGTHVLSCWSWKSPNPP